MLSASFFIAMLSVVMLSVVMLSGLAPLRRLVDEYKDREVRLKLELTIKNG